MREKSFVFLFRDCVSVKGCAAVFLYECYIKSFCFLFQREEKCEQWRIKWCTISFVLFTRSINTCRCVMLLFVYISSVTSVTRSTIKKSL